MVDNRDNIGVQSSAGLPTISYADYMALRILSQEFTQSMMENQQRLLTGQWALENKRYKNEQQKKETEDIVRQAMLVQPKLDRFADFFFSQLQAMEKHIDNIINISNQVKERQIKNIQDDMRRNMLNQEANKDIVKAAEETVKNKGKTPPVPPSSSSDSK